MCFWVFICCSRCVMIVFRPRHHVWHWLGGALRGEHRRPSVSDGRQAAAAAHCDPVDAAGGDRGEESEEKRRTSGSGAAGGEICSGVSRKSEKRGFNDAESQRERRHFAAGDFQSWITLSFSFSFTFFNLLLFSRFLLVLCCSNTVAGWLMFSWM